MKIQEAKGHVQQIYEQQRDAYNNFNSALQMYGNGMTLEDVFKQQQNLFGDENEQQPQQQQIEKLQEDSQMYVEKLQQAQARFHANFLATIDKVASATTIKDLDRYRLKISDEATQLERLLQEAIAHFKNKKTIQRLKTTRKNNAGNIKITPNGDGISVVFDKKGKKQLDKDYLEAIREYFKAVSAIGEVQHSSGKNFGKSSTFRESYKDLYSTYNDRRKDLYDKFSGTYSRETIRNIERYVRELIFADNTKSPPPLAIHTKDRGEAIVQAASFAFEETSITHIKNILMNALEDNAAVESFIIEVPVRVQFSQLPLAEARNEVFNLLHTQRNKLDLKLYSFFRSQRVLDKVDSYVSVDFKQTNPYVLAFSNKLYHDLSRLTLVGSSKKILTDEGEELSKTQTNLTNTYDLLAQAGAVADDFMYAVLNGSTASGLRTNITEASLEKWLTAFTYEMAFNPKSFVQEIQNTIPNFLESNIIYIFNAGARIEPVYKILEKLITFLENAEIAIQSCVNTKIQFDNSNAYDLLNWVDKIEPPYTTQLGHTRYPPEAWAAVADRVSKNTLVSVHLDLLNLQF